MSAQVKRDLNGPLHQLAAAGFIACRTGAIESSHGLQQAIRFGLIALRQNRAYAVFSMLVLECYVESLNILIKEDQYRSGEKVPQERQYTDDNGRILRPYALIDGLYCALRQVLAPRTIWKSPHYPVFHWILVAFGKLIATVLELFPPDPVSVYAWLPEQVQQFHPHWVEDGLVRAIK